MFVVGGDHEYYVMVFGGGARCCVVGGDCFVVGVGVEEDECGYYVILVVGVVTLSCLMLLTCRFGWMSYFSWLGFCGCADLGGFVAGWFWVWCG